MTVPVKTAGKAASLSAGRPPVVSGVALVIVMAVVVGLLVTSGVVATQLSDPGAFVRWGLPVVKALSWVMAVATFGLLGGAAFIIPERTNTNRRVDAARLAAGFALLWFLTKCAQLVLTFADIAGLPVTDPQLLSQLRAFVWALDVTRVLAIVSGIAAFVAVLAFVAASRATMAWLTVLTALGIILPALNGHAGGQATHEDAVNSAGLHYLGVAIWFAGLLALLVLRRTLGKDLGVSVQRFSVLATWALVMTGMAGLHQALIRLETPSGLFTAYGALVAAKAVTFAALGWFGWRQRQGIATLLARNPGSGRTFARLAALELGLIATAAGLGVALSRSAPPALEPAPNRSLVQVLTGYPDPGQMLSWTQWFTAWRLNGLFLALGVLLIGLYLAGVVRLARRGDSWPWWRTLLWCSGWLLWIYFTNGAPSIWGRVTFSDHMIMHMGVAMTIPLFLVPAAPLTLALRTIPARKDRTWGPRELLLQITHSRVSRFLANPAIAATIFFTSMALFYYTPLFELALTTHTGHLLMMGHFLLTGYLFVWVLIGVDPGPPRWQPLALLTVLFATVAFHAFFGVVLTGATIQLAPDFFDVIKLPWVPNPLLDQQEAGMIAWGVGEAPTLVLALIVAIQWFKADARDAARLDRQANRDGDADLAAYNAWLASLRDDPAAAQDPGHLERKG